MNIGKSGVYESDLSLEAYLTTTPQLTTKIVFSSSL